MQRVVEDIESHLTGKTILGVERNFTSTVTAFLQKVESDVLKTALKAPDQKIQKVQYSTVGKKTVKPETHSGVVTNWGPREAMREVNKDCVCPIYRASQVALVVKNPPANAGDIRDVGSIPESRRPPGGGHGNPLQYSCLENPHG